MTQPSEKVTFSDEKVILSRSGVRGQFRSLVLYQDLEFVADKDAVVE